MFYLIENITYDFNKGIIHKNGEKIELTKLQRKLLNYYIKNPNTILSKNQIMKRVWGRIINNNSIDQINSILRNLLEKDPANPNVIISHFGKGISFEGDIIRQEGVRNETIKFKLSNNIKKLPFLYLLLPLLVILYFWLAYNNKTSDNSNYHFDQKTKLLILPLSYKNLTLSNIEKLGVQELLHSTFSQLDSEGQIIFDKSSQTIKQSIEKQWSIEKNLIIVHSQVMKEEGLYKSIIKLSDGVNTIETKNINAENLNELLNKQIEYISSIQSNKNSQFKPSIKQSYSRLYIKALGYKNSKNYEKAQELFKNILQEKDDYYQARFNLTAILISEKKYDQALAHLQTLKATKAYQIIGTEIELNLAEIYLSKNESEKVITDLNDYQSKHLSLGKIKKAKVNQMLAKAYDKSGNYLKAQELYMSSRKGIDDREYSLLYAKSFYGQARALVRNSINDNVYDLFQKSYHYAKLADNIHYQILALNELSAILFARFEWEEAISLQKQSIQLMELDNNPEETAKGLNTLVSILNQRGHFTEAKEVNAKLEKIANKLNSDLLKMIFIRNDAIIAMNTFDWTYAQQQIDKQRILTKKTKNIGMQLDCAFLDFELRLLKKDTKNFKGFWDKNSKLLKEQGYGRYQIYLDLYLARYYKQINQEKQAIELINQLIDKAMKSKDYKIIVDASNQLAEIYFKTDPKKSLVILNNIKKYNPHPNPYLDLKAKSLHLLNKNIEALSTINQAKLVYFESWTVENQNLMEQIKNSIKK